VELKRKFWKCGTFPGVELWGGLLERRRVLAPHPPGDAFAAGGTPDRAVGQAP